jgi:hypothetical protein
MSNRSQRLKNFWPDFANIHLVVSQMPTCKSWGMAAVRAALLIQLFGYAYFFHLTFGMLDLNP